MMPVTTTYRVEYVHWFAEPDDLEHSCDPDKAVSGTSRDYIEAESLEELVEFLFEYAGAVDVDWDAVELDAGEEPGRVDIQLMTSSAAGAVYTPGEVMGALQAQSAARVACRLTGEDSPEPSVWLTTYTMYVERVTVEAGVALEPLRASQSGAAVPA